MKTLPLLAALAALLFAGCESTSFSDRFETVPPQVQSVPGEVEEVYFAAQKAFKRLDFVLTRSSMGRVEAASAIRTSETFGDSRQMIARLKITQGEAGQSEVALSLTEEAVSASMGGTRQQGLRDHGFYQLYFATLQQVLVERATDRAVEKN
ncbi:hypothetical protein Verru16b_02654 [Lacunisphaera limnophila]|uniref:Lipoprotein n=1 Tax=Lacunisphaera limnophila TaxID=1838286 RepID=A0A1D8AXG1_9BACT|nr:hypothetical protein [Lacunisphaera limnophila]AOS45571.1 hypothetical protein Verru16b_02654 [Lacunisphaera limnophila]